MPVVIELLRVPYGRFQFPEWLDMVCARQRSFNFAAFGTVFGLLSEGARSVRVSLGTGLVGARFSDFKPC